jgi:hypothetical protein
LNHDRQLRRSWADNPKLLTANKTQPEMCRLLGFGREAALYVQASRPKSAVPFSVYWRFITPGHQPSACVGLVGYSFFIVEGA